MARTRIQVPNCPKPKLPETLCLSAALLGLLYAPGVAAETFLELKARQAQEAEAPPAPTKPRKAKRVPSSRKPKPPAKPAVVETQEASPVPESPQAEETRLTKNWGGARSRLSDLGVDLGLIYKGEVFATLSGAQRTTEYLDNLDIRASFDLEKLASYRGASLFVYALGNHGGHPSASTGAFQTSNIETRGGAFRLYEAWMQQLLFEGRFSVLLGLHDLNSEFYVTETSGLFFVSSFGVGSELAQTGLNGPSIFPVAAPAVRFRFEPSPELMFQFAVFNALAGNPDSAQGTQISLNARDGQLVIAEINYLRGADPAAQARAKYGMGFWTYTRTFDHLSETDGSGNAIPATSRGVYWLADRDLGGGLAAFFRYGVASTETNEYGSNLAWGLVMTGLVPGRGNDRLGFGYSRVNAGEPHNQARAAAGDPVGDAETALEATYRFEALPGVAIQPFYQWYLQPSADATATNARATGVRVEINF